MLVLLRNPFWPSLMVITILIAAFAVGSLEAKRRGAAWPLHGLLAYALPALLVTLLGAGFAAGSYDTSEFYRCHDRVCQAAAAASANNTLWMEYALAELAGLATIAVVMWMKGWVGRVKISLPVPVRTRPAPEMSVTSDGRVYFNPDPQKWHFDEDSGEFYPIDYTHGDNVVFKAIPYSKRKLKHLEDMRGDRWAKPLCIISWMVFLPSLVWIMNTSGVTVLGIAIFLLMPSGLMAIGMTCTWLYMAAFGSRRAAAKVGPPPIAPRGIQEVHEQKAHGDARVTDWETLQAALNARAAAPVEPAARTASSAAGSPMRFKE